MRDGFDGSGVHTGFVRKVEFQTETRREALREPDPGWRRLKRLEMGDLDDEAKRIKRQPHGPRRM